MVTEAHHVDRGYEDFAGALAPGRQGNAPVSRLPDRPGGPARRRPRRRPGGAGPPAVLVERGGEADGGAAGWPTGPTGPTRSGSPAPGGREVDPDRPADRGRGGWPEAGAIEQVAVLAVDPTSPFTGGAILGDRVRMRSTISTAVFIRSMATRGHLGGLAWPCPRPSGSSPPPASRLVIVETVGVGQMEVEVASAADTTVVVVHPGWGDSIQANKAGLLEMADVFVINKADLPAWASPVAISSRCSTCRPGGLAAAHPRNGGGQRRGRGRAVGGVARHRDHLDEAGPAGRRPDGSPRSSVGCCGPGLGRDRRLAPAEEFATAVEGARPPASSIPYEAADRASSPR